MIWGENAVLQGKENDIVHGFFDAATKRVEWKAPKEIGVLVNQRRFFFMNTNTASPNSFSCCLGSVSAVTLDRI